MRYRYCIKLTTRFLLAKVQLDSVLEAEFPLHMGSQLNDLPKSPSASYMKGLERIQAAKAPAQKEALHALAWIYHAKRKLKMGELLAAVGWTVHSVTEYKLESIHLMEMCRGLAMHDGPSDTVQFIHGTVETFFKQSFCPEPIKGANVLKADIIDALEPFFLRNIDLAKACLTYFSLDIFNKPCPDYESLSRRTRKYGFSIYAASHWADHIRGVAETDQGVQAATFKAFGPVGTRMSVLEIKGEVDGLTWSKSPPSSLIYYFVENRIPSMLINLLSNDTSNMKLRYVLCSVTS